MPLKPDILSAQPAPPMNGLQYPAYSHVNSPNNQYPTTTQFINDPNSPFTYMPIVYGRYEFTNYVISNINMENIYADDGLTVKYRKVTLDVEFIITREMVSSIAYQTPLATPKTIDFEMDAIREELMKPHQLLLFWYRGWGAKTNIIGQADLNTLNSFGLGPNQSGSVSTYFPYHLTDNIVDGPFPSIMTWESLGASGAKCRWRVVFNTTNFTMFSGGANNANLGITGTDVLYKSRRTAGFLSTRSIENVINTYFTSLYANSQAGTSLNSNDPAFGWNFVLSINEEHEIEIAEDGTTVMTTIGVIELSGGSHNYDPALSSTPSAVPRLIQLLTHYFEPLHPIGFQRSQKYRYRKSKREIEYVITDKEMPSDNPLMPGIIKADVSQEVSSSLFGDDYMNGSGFYTWKVDFQGTITTAPGIWKGWAWLAMMTIVNQRMNRTASQTAQIAKLKDWVDGQINVVDQEAVPKEKKKVKPRHLLTNISVRENIYSRESSFNLTYMLLSPLESLFDNSGLFFPAYISWNKIDGNTPTYPADFGIVPTNPRITDPNDPMVSLQEPYYDQWRRSRESLAQTQNVFGYRGPLLPNYNIVFDPYTGIDSNREAVPRTNANRNPSVNPNLPNTYRDPEHVALDQNSNTSNQELFNIHNLAKHRRNANVEIFGDLFFPDGLGNQILKSDPKNRAPGKAPNGSTQQVYPGGDDSTAPWLRFGDPAQTWLAYDARFEILRNENSVFMPLIESQNKEHRFNSDLRRFDRSTTGFTIDNRANPIGAPSNMPDVDNYQYHDVQVMGRPVTYVRFYGSAARVGYEIPTPSLVGILPASMQTNNNAANTTFLVKAYKVNTSVWRHYQANVSADMPVFVAEWDIMYALKGDPVCANISFRAPTSAEFLS